MKEKNQIIIKNAHLHNLKNINLSFPKNKLIVITGVSGSGKSSLAFDTIFAEGQRRYVESLSSYARQFLGKLEKPKVDDIEGIAPSIAIQQNTYSSNPRSTVGTITEIYDYLKLLFARGGKTFSPISGKEVKKDEIGDVLDYIKAQKIGENLTILSPIKWEKENFKKLLSLLKEQGFVRLEIENNIVNISDLESFGFEPKENTEINLVIERFEVENNEDFFSRIADSLQIAFQEGKGSCLIKNIDKGRIKKFSNKFELDGIKFIEPNINLFSFNNPYGACPTCEGFGMILGIDEDLIVPNKTLSLYEDAIIAWRGEKMSKWKKEFIKLSKKTKFPIHKPYYELSKENKDLLWNGIGENDFPCINNFFKMLEENQYKIQYRVMLSKYRGKSLCRECGGKRIRKESNYVKIDNYSINDLLELPIDEISIIIKNFKLSKYQKEVSKRILYEIKNRLNFLLNVGLGYLTLNRGANTLSGGESQRIKLATSLGSSLIGSIYILDEPSIGLHPIDTERLISVLKKLQNLNNTVIVVEHDQEIMQAADYIIDIGPFAGQNGGEVVFSGDYKSMLKSNTLTAKYLSGEQQIKVPSKRRIPNNFIKIIGACQNNLKNIDIKFPLNCMTVICGVSGSGKSTLMKSILAPAIKNHLGISAHTPGSYTKLEGNLDLIQKIEMVDQKPIGKSSRSNPVTYLKAYDDIRDLFSKQKLSKICNFKPRHFSFNIDGGRCDSCQGEGFITVEMQFMADIKIICEDCSGKRFKKEILDVEFENKNIADILDMTISKAIDFFTTKNQEKIASKIMPLKKVGLGYLKLGQSSSSLSGGEAQRVKLASFLSKELSSEKTLFIFDEPSTGLHFDDINKLLISFQSLIELGHTIFIIEHHPDIIKCADHIIEIGPGGGKNGGKIIFEGTPEQMVKNKNSITGKYIKNKLS